MLLLATWLSLFPHTHTHLSVEYIVGMRLLFINLGRDTVLLIPREVAKVTGLPLPWLLFVEVFLQDIFSFGKWPEFVPILCKSLFFQIALICSKKYHLQARNVFTYLQRPIQFFLLKATVISKCFFFKQITFLDTNMKCKYPPKTQCQVYEVRRTLHKGFSSLNFNWNLYERWAV